MEEQQVQEEIKKGLLASPKYIPTWYLYDENGSNFRAKAINMSKNYYLRESVLAIFSKYMEEMLDFAKLKCTVIDFGCGDGIESNQFLRRLLKRQNTLEYIPVDISKEMLLSTCESFKKEHGEALEITPIPARIDDDMDLFRNVQNNKFILCFNIVPGMTYDEQIRFLLSINNHMTENDAILISFDTTTDENQVKAAYTPTSDFSRMFYLNPLHRLNKEMSGNINVSLFDLNREFEKNTSPDQVSYLKVWTECREAHSCLLKALNLTIDFEAKERIYLQNDGKSGFSCKYTIEQIQTIATKAGLSVSKVWTDPEKHSAVCCFKKLDH